MARDSIAYPAMRFLRLTRLAWRRVSRRTAAILGTAASFSVSAGVTDLRGLAEPTARVLLDVLHARFVPWLWVLILLGSVLLKLHQGNTARLMLPKVAALLAMPLGGLIVAAPLLAVVEFALGLNRDELQSASEWLAALERLEPSVYAAAIANMAYGLLHLAALAVFFQVVVRRRGLAMLATLAVWAGLNLVFEHPLLRFGTSAIPWSDMNGFDHDGPLQTASTIYWTGISVALLAIAHQVAERRTARSPWDINRDAATFGWAGAVAAVVTGGWMLHNLDAAPRTAPQADGLPAQPTYLRVTLNVEIHPQDRMVRSRGTAIVVNRSDAFIPELQFAIPGRMTVRDIDLTGAPVADSRQPRFLLNRPLEPGETLKVEFELERRDNALRPPAARDLLDNGTFLTTADLIPAFGAPASIEAFLAAAPPVHFATRISTSLDQIAIAPGAEIRAWKENGRAFFDYRADAPIPPLASFHSARYALARYDWNGTPVHIYHHPPHARFLDSLFAAASERMEARSRQAPYAHPHFRLIEVPDHTRQAGPLPYISPWHPAQWHPLYVGALPYSELATLAR